MNLVLTRGESKIPKKCQTLYVHASPPKKVHLTCFDIIQLFVPAFTSQYHIPIRVSSSPLCCTQQRRSAAWATFLIFSAHLLHCLSSLFSSLLPPKKNAAAPFFGAKNGKQQLSLPSSSFHPSVFPPFAISWELHYTPLLRKLENGSRTFWTQSPHQS